jgi:hypothetical protein
LRPASATLAFDDDAVHSMTSSAGEECRRHGEADRFCGYHVDDQFEFCWLLDGQVGRPLTFQNLVHIDRPVERLTDLRVWLDEHRYQPSTFTYFFLHPGMMIRVPFKIDDEAKAIAQEFGGSLLDTPWEAATRRWQHMRRASIALGILETA